MDYRHVLDVWRPGLCFPFATSKSTGTTVACSQGISSICSFVSCSLVVHNGHVGFRAAVIVQRRLHVNNTALLSPLIMFLFSVVSSLWSESAYSSCSLSLRLQAVYRERTTRCVPLERVMCSCPRSLSNCVPDFVCPPAPVLLDAWDVKSLSSHKSGCVFLPLPPTLVTDLLESVCSDISLCPPLN